MYWEAVITSHDHGVRNRSAGHERQQMLWQTSQGEDVYTASWTKSMGPNPPWFQSTELPDNSFVYGTWFSMLCYSILGNWCSWLSPSSKQRMMVCCIHCGRLAQSEGPLQILLVDLCWIYILPDIFIWNFDNQFCLVIKIIKGYISNNLGNHRSSMFWDLC